MCKKGQMNDRAFRIIEGQQPVLVFAKDEVIWREQHKGLKVMYKCAGEGATGKCSAEMNLIRRNEERYKDYFKAKDASTHLKDCSYSSEYREIVNWIDSHDLRKVNLESIFEGLKNIGEDNFFSMEKSEKESAHSEVNNSDLLEERVIDRVRKLKDVLKVYTLFSFSSIYDELANGMRIEQVFLDWRSFVKFRKKEVVFSEKMSLSIMRGGIGTSICNLFFDKQKPAVVLQDPYLSRETRLPVIFVLRFQTWDLYKAYKERKLLRLNDGSMYVVLARWKLVERSEMPNRVIYEGKITKMSQIVELKGEDNRECQAYLFKRGRGAKE